MSVLVAGHLGNFENRQLKCNTKVFMPSNDFCNNFDFDQFRKQSQGKWGQKADQKIDVRINKKNNKAFMTNSPKFLEKTGSLMSFVDSPEIESQNSTVDTHSIRSSKSPPSPTELVIHKNLKSQQANRNQENQDFCEATR